MLPIAISILTRYLVSVMIALSSISTLWLPSANSPCGPQPVFSDEFNGNSLDQQKWNVTYPSGSGELQQYIPDAFSFDNGILKIHAVANGNSELPFTSGILTTKGKFTQEYGYFEIRARVPKGQGLFPAFWLMPANGKWPPELDVFEVLGQDSSKVYMTVHYTNSNHYPGEVQGSYSGPDLSLEFHTYGLDWEPDRLTWYVDGVERFSTTQNVPHEPMFLLINLAVGGDWPGPPDHKTPFPSEFDINYVRVFSAKCTRQPSSDQTH
jgi:beta-glucanase (GH16 family)